jgi:UDP-2,3-diacylglucosamine hydrolase
MELAPGKKVYFASDFHLGTPSYEKSLIREKRICQWLDSIQDSCGALYLVGDIFDFWFEYKHAIPKGFVRLQGKIAAFTDAGIPVYVFTGNHDMWIFDYLPQELGVKLFKEPVIHSYFDKKLYIGHGDGLGPGDRGYKFLKKVFANPLCQWLFARLHPNFGIGLANYSSKSSRASTGHTDEIFLGEEKEWLVIYSKEQQQILPVDYYIFGHRHLPLKLTIDEQATYYNLGDWLKYETFGVLDENGFTLRKWNAGEPVDYFSSY